MIKVGDVCIWQNLEGRRAYLNGSETTVTEPLMPRMCENETTKERHTVMCYGTDTMVPEYALGAIARPHQLRKKYPDADDEELMRESEQDRELVNQ